MNILICTIKSWNIKKAKKLYKVLGDSHLIELIQNQEEFTLERVTSFKPDYIFFPRGGFESCRGI